MMGWFLRRREERRAIRLRLQAVVAEAQGSRECPVCGRPMARVAARMVEVTHEGTREIGICTVCASLGLVESIVAAANESVAAVENGA